MARRMAFTVCAAAFLAVLPIANVRSHHEPDHFYDCEPYREPPDLLTTPRVLVYFETGRVDRAEFVGCHRPTRTQHLLADGTAGRDIFAIPSALDARKSLVAYAVRDQGRTVVELRDVADEPGPWPCVGCGVKQPRPLRRLSAAYHPRREIGVEALVLGRGHALAWATCPLGPKYDRYYDVYAYDKCVRPHGSRVRIWRARAGSERPELLDQGRHIPALKLRVERGRIYWRKGPHVWSAKL